jgi:hypothetical protein
VQWRLGKSYKEHKRLTELSCKDKKMVKKIKIILDSIGKMQRAIEDPNDNTDLELNEKKCFKTIRELSEDEISARDLPNKAQLASAAISTLPSEHPIKKELEVIQKLTPRGESSEGAFKDIGQKAGARHSSPRMYKGKEKSSQGELEGRWHKLRTMMHGLYVDHIICDDGTLLGNCTPINQRYKSTEIGG